MILSDGSIFWISTLSERIDDFAADRSLIEDFFKSGKNVVSLKRLHCNTICPSPATRISDWYFVRGGKGLPKPETGNYERF